MKTGRGRPPPRRGERPRRKPTLSAPRSQTSGLQGCEETHVCCGSPPESVHRVMVALAARDARGDPFPAVNTAPV